MRITNNKKRSNNNNNTHYLLTSSLPAEVKNESSSDSRQKKLQNVSFRKNAEEVDLLVLVRKKLSQTKLWSYQKIEKRIQKLKQQNLFSTLLSDALSSQEKERQTG